MNVTYFQKGKHLCFFEEPHPNLTLLYLRAYRDGRETSKKEDTREIFREKGDLEFKSVSGFRGGFSLLTLTSHKVMH
jgi:hypothetical protein